MGVASLFRAGKWPLYVGAYSRGLGLGVYYISDGETLIGWRAAVWVGGMSGFLGLFPGLFISRD